MHVMCMCNNAIHLSRHVNIKISKTLRTRTLIPRQHRFISVFRWTSTLKKIYQTNGLQYFIINLPCDGYLRVISNRFRKTNLNNYTTNRTEEIQQKKRNRCHQKFVENNISRKNYYKFIWRDEQWNGWPLIPMYIIYKSIKKRC